VFEIWSAVIYWAAPLSEKTAIGCVVSGAINTRRCVFLAKWRCPIYYRFRCGSNFPYALVSGEYGRPLHSVEKGRKAAKAAINLRTPNSHSLSVK
jgi:hypothetical protein